MYLLYEEMKYALSYFGLNFSQMNLVHVKLSEGAILFLYNGRSVCIEMPHEPV
jgi:hypothetical protein